MLNINRFPLWCFLEKSFRVPKVVPKKVLKIVGFK